MMAPMTRHKEPGERKNLDWKNVVLPTAKRIVDSYDTEVTVRQLFYRLVSLPHDDPARLPNTLNYYNSLSRYTAEGRRDGTFPDLVDPLRGVDRPLAYTSPAVAIERLRYRYRRDRTEGQPYQIWLGVEKSGLNNQLWSWFADRSLPIFALGGQAKQSHVDMIRRGVEADGRPAILLYAGDHDPSGWSILQSFIDRTDCWSNPELPEWDPDDMPPNRGYKQWSNGQHREIPNFDLYRKYRVALTPEQCDDYDLPRNSAKEKDPNTDQFLATFEDTLTDDEVDDGLGVQIEVDAIDPNVLHDLFADAIEMYWDDEAFEAVQAEEEDDIEQLDAIIAGLG